MLCEPGINGGKGLTPKEVGDLTLDQVFMLSCEFDHMKGRDGQRTDNQAPLQAAATMAEEDGLISGRDGEGKPIKARILGKSLYQRLVEKAELEKAEEINRRTRKGRRRRKRKDRE